MLGKYNVYPLEFWLTLFSVKPKVFGVHVWAMWGLNTNSNVCSWYVHSIPKKLRWTSLFSRNTSYKSSKSPFLGSLILDDSIRNQKIHPNSESTYFGPRKKHLKNHQLPIGSMYAIYSNIYIHLPSIYPSHVSIDTSTMDPMGYRTGQCRAIFHPPNPVFFSGQAPIRLHGRIFSGRMPLGSKCFSVSTREDGKSKLNLMIFLIFHDLKMVSRCFVLVSLLTWCVLLQFQACCSNIRSITFRSGGIHELTSNMTTWRSWIQLKFDTDICSLGW